MNHYTQPRTEAEIRERDQWLIDQRAKDKANWEEHTRRVHQHAPHDDGPNPGEIDYIALNREFGLS